MRPQTVRPHDLSETMLGATEKRQNDTGQNDVQWNRELGSSVTPPLQSNLSYVPAAGSPPLFCPHYSAPIILPPSYCPLSFCLFRTVTIITRAARLRFPLAICPNALPTKPYLPLEASLSINVTTVCLPGFTRPISCCHFPLPSR